MTREERIQRAIDRAEEDAGGEEPPPGTVGAPAKRRVALGDPQAPLARALDILDRHGMLGDDGRLVPDVELVSVGDHFDWGPPGAREQAAREGLWLLAWLAAHPPDRVTLVAGNHDLARVGELAPFDDATYAAARAEADAIYRGPHAGDMSRAIRLLAEHPSIPSVEVLARDLSCFRVEQRALVARLLRAGRLRAALAASGDLLVVHAGVTGRELDALGLAGDARRDAGAIARAMNAALDGAVAAWDGGALAIPGLHRPGSARDGEGRGAFLHRAADPSSGDPALFAGPLRRRFSPLELPRGLVQVIGHVRDGKSRELLAPFADGAPAEDGPVRCLQTDGETARYARGVPARTGADLATVIHVDGGMLHADPARYELWDLDRRVPLVPA